MLYVQMSLFFMPSYSSPGKKTGIIEFHCSCHLKFFSQCLQLVLIATARLRLEHLGLAEKYGYSLFFLSGCLKNFIIHLQSGKKKFVLSNSYMVEKLLVMGFRLCSSSYFYKFFFQPLTSILLHTL